MQEFREAVPLFLARMVGHACGIIFVSLAALAIWMVHKLIGNPSAGALAIFSCTSAITGFFGSLAFKLSTKSSDNLFSSRIVLTILGLAPVLAILAIVLALLEFASGGIGIVQLLITILFASVVGSFCFIMRRQFNKTS